MYVRLLDELADRWRMEYQSALTGWHVAASFAEEEQPARPDLIEWATCKQAFDDWLVSDPDTPAADDDEDTLDPEALDYMIAMGWRD